MKHVGQLKFDGRRILHNDLTLCLGENGWVGEAGDSDVFKIDLLEVVGVHKGLILKSLASRDLYVLKAKGAGLVLVAVKINGKRNAGALTILKSNIHKRAILTPLLTPSETEEGVGLLKGTVLNDNIALRLGYLDRIVAKIQKRRMLSVAMCLIGGSRRCLFGL